MAAKFKVACPGRKTAYFQSFMGAYQRVIDILRAPGANEVPEPTAECGYVDGLGIWERMFPGEGGWRFDRTNTAEAWREATSC